MTVRRQVLDHYRTQGARTRLHTTIRWATCPFEAVAAHLPPTGRVLEVGCGHGLFSVLAATQAPGRVVVGTDVDGHKIDAATAVADRAPAFEGRLQFAPSRPGEVPDGPWDAIAVVDVLYLIDAEGEERLVRDLAGQLAPGGVLLVKEMAQRPAWKFALARLQERISVQVLGITEGDELTFLAPSEIGRWMTDAGLEVEHLPVDRGYLHPHHLVVGRNPR